MALKFWRENFYVLFPVPCSSFPGKSGNSRELLGSYFREFPNWHNLIRRTRGFFKIFDERGIFGWSPHMYLCSWANACFNFVSMGSRLGRNLKIASFKAWFHLINVNLFELLIFQLNGEFNSYQIQFTSRKFFATNFSIRGFMNFLF